MNIRLPLLLLASSLALPGGAQAQLSRHPPRTERAPPAPERLAPKRDVRQFEQADEQAAWHQRKIWCDANRDRSRAARKACKRD